MKNKFMKKQKTYEEIPVERVMKKAYRKKDVTLLTYTVYATYIFPNEEQQSSNLHNTSIL